MPISGSSNSAAKKDIMSKIGQLEIQLSDRVENIVGTLRVISPFPTMFSKAVFC